MSEDQIDWAAVRADYEAGEITVAQICADHLVAGWMLYARRKSEGWQLRRPVFPMSRGNLVARLYRLVERQIGELEMKTDAFGDKEAAILGNLTRNLEKLSELDRKQNGAGETRRRRSDIDAMRRKIVKRLEQLQQR